MRTTMGYPAGGHVEAAAAFAFDASSFHAGQATQPGSPFSWTHTPVGIPKGVVVFVAQENATTDHVTAVTYGGVALTNVSVSPLISALGAEEDCVVNAFFKGTGLPSGAQTISVTYSAGAASTNAAALTVVGPNDSAIMDTSTADTTGTNPTCALTISQSSVVCGILFSGANDFAATTIASGYTQILGVDVGSQITSIGYKNALTASNSSMNWTDATSRVYCILAVSIKST